MEGTIKKIVATLLIFILSGVLASPVIAQEDAPNASISVSPVIYEEEMQPGETKTKNITLTNNADFAQNLIAEVADFYYDVNGSMKFYEESEDNPSTSSLKKWLSYESKEFLLNARESKTISFTITVPANAEAGGHYGVMFVRTKPTNDAAGAVSISSRVGVLVLVTIPGDVKKSGTVADFQVGTVNDKNILTPQSFFEKGPVGFSFTISNTGNAHFRPEGNIVIKDMYGNVVKEVPPQDTRSFPGTPRTYVQKADLSPWGTYEATIAFKDGDGNPMQVMKVGFWGFNYILVIQWTILIVVILAALIIGLKQYNKWIIASAHKAAGHHKK